MKIAKASEQDIDAAGNAMSVLNDIGSGYYPAPDGEEDAPTCFDPDDSEHLRRFYDLMTATLDASPGWPGRVIGGMCYVVMYDKNQIVNQDVDTLELHPRFKAAADELEALLAQRGELEKDAARYRWLAAYARSTSEHWGGRWSLVIDGPAPKSHDSEDDLDAAIDAAIAKAEGKEGGAA